MEYAPLSEQQSDTHIPNAFDVSVERHFHMRKFDLASFWLICQTQSSARTAHATKLTSFRWLMVACMQFGPTTKQKKNEIPPRVIRFADLCQEDGPQKLNHSLSFWLKRPNSCIAIGAHMAKRFPFVFPLKHWIEKRYAMYLRHTHCANEYLLFICNLTTCQSYM